MQQPELLRHLQNLQRKTNARLTLINDAGIVRFDSSTGQQDIGVARRSSRDKEKRAASGVGFQQRDSTTLELPLFYLAIPLFDEREDPGSRENGFVRVAFEEQRVFDTIRSFQRFLALFTIGSGLLAGLLMVVFASREMRPLPRFADAARSVASGQYVMLPGLAQRDDESEIAGRRLLRHAVGIERTRNPPTRKQSTAGGGAGKHGGGCLGGRSSQPRAGREPGGQPVAGLPSESTVEQTLAGNRPPTGTRSGHSTHAGHRVGNADGIRYLDHPPRTLEVRWHPCWTRRNLGHPWCTMSPT